MTGGTYIESAPGKVHFPPCILAKDRLSRTAFGRDRQFGVSSGTWICLAHRAAAANPGGEHVFLPAGIAGDVGERGEPGVGKTRLAREAVLQAAETGRDSDWVAADEKCLDPAAGSAR